MATTSTKEQVAEATRVILEAEGAEAVSMRRVAAAVGVTPMALYRHYRNREALLGEICDAAFEEVAGTWQQRPDGADPIENLLATAGILVDFALARPRLYSYMFTERRDQARSYPDDFAAGRSPTVNVLVGVIEHGMDVGAFRRDDPLATGLTVAAQLHGLIALYLGERIGLTHPEFRELCRGSLRRLIDGIKS
jgi:AcrR family transcriptional regulator